MRWFLSLLLVAALPAQAHGGGFDSGPIEPGASRWTVFQDLTEIAYEDAHTGATGTVRAVQAEGEPRTHTVQILDDPARFEPAHLVVHVGDQVTWINNGTQTHSVRAVDPAHAEHAAPVQQTQAAPAKDAPAPAVPLLVLALALVAGARRCTKRA